MFVFSTKFKKALICWLPYNLKCMRLTALSLRWTLRFAVFFAPFVTSCWLFFWMVSSQEYFLVHDKELWRVWSTSSGKLEFRGEVFHLVSADCFLEFWQQGYFLAWQSHRYQVLVIREFLLLLVARFRLVQSGWCQVSGSSGAQYSLHRLHCKSGRAPDLGSTILIMWPDEWWMLCIFEFRTCTLFNYSAG